MYTWEVLLIAPKYSAGCTHRWLSIGENIAIYKHQYKSFYADMRQYINKLINIYMTIPYKPIINVRYQC